MKTLIKSALALLTLATMACDFGSEVSAAQTEKQVQVSARHGDNMSRPELIILRDGNLWGSASFENLDYAWVWSDIAFESDAQPYSFAIDGLNGVDVEVNYCGTEQTFTNAWFVQVTNLNGCNDVYINLSEAQDFSVYYQWQ